MTSRMALCVLAVASVALLLHCSDEIAPVDEGNDQDTGTGHDVGPITDKDAGRKDAGGDAGKHDGGDAGDAGKHDGGDAGDAGRPDGSVDAGPEDGGVDAGSKDGGGDAGDAGSEITVEIMPAIASV